LAVLEKAEVIGPLEDAEHHRLPNGTVAAGYQNFLICIEMFFAAVALKYAFPVHVSFKATHIILEVYLQFVYCYIRFILEETVGMDQGEV